MALKIIGSLLILWLVAGGVSYGFEKAMDWANTNAPTSRFATFLKAILHTARALVLIAFWSAFAYLAYEEWTRPKAKPSSSGSTSKPEATRCENVGYDRQGAYCDD
jgi:hypothetical protein